jgi:hypothetical protein
MSTSEIDKNRFEDICGRLMTALGMSFEYNIADRLGLRRDAFSARKKRGALPIDKIQLLCTQEGLNFDWVMTGEGEPTKAVVAAVKDPLGDLPTPVAKAVEVMLKNPSQAWELYAKILELADKK